MANCAAPDCADPAAEQSNFCAECRARLSKIAKELFPNDPRHRRPRVSTAAAKVGNAESS
jgi:hypothetical protein